MMRHGSIVVHDRGQYAPFLRIVLTR
jgi:hypothetical protein